MHNLERAKEDGRAVFSMLALIFILTLCPSLEAERRGIIVSIIMIDRSRIQGELVAVRRESIVLQEDSGLISFIDVGNIKYIEKPRRSALIGAIKGILKYGFIGVAVGDFVTATDASKNALGRGTLAGGAAGAFLGGLLGGIQGSSTNAVDTIYVQGYPPEIIKSALLELSRDARIRDWT